MTSKRTLSGTDNFMRIKGISRSVERRLHEAGTATYAKLASLTPHAISAILGDVNGVTTRQIIKERWIEQARSLSSRPASTRPEVEAASQDNFTSAKSKGLASFIVQLLLDEEGRTKHTKVMRSDTGIEDEWDGWQERRLLDFIVTRAGMSPPAAEADLPIATPAEKTPEAGMKRETIPAHLTEPGPAPPAKSRITAPLQAVAIATSAGGPTSQKSGSIPAEAKAASGILAANQPFAVRLALDHPEIASPKMRSLNYKANIYAKSLKGHLCLSVGEADGQLKPTDTATITINGNPLPQGFYRLQAVIGLLDPSSPSKRQTSSVFQTGEKLLQVV